MATTHVKRDADDESEWWRLLCWAQYKDFIIVLGRDVERRTSFEYLKQKRHLLAVIGAAPRHTWRSKEERSWNENRHNTHTIHGRTDGSLKETKQNRRGSGIGNGRGLGGCCWMINITAWAFTLTRLLARNGNTFRVVACYLYTHTQSQKSIVNRRTHVSGYHSSPPTHRTILIRSSSSSAGNTDLQHSNKSWRFVGHHITRSPTRDRGSEIASEIASKRVR